MATYDPNKDYQAEINQRKKANPNDPQIAVLEEQRAAKLDDQNRAFVGIPTTQTTAPVSNPAPVVTTPPVTNPAPVVTQTTVTNPAPVTNPSSGNPVLGKTSIGGAISQVNNGVNPVTNTPLQLQPQPQPQPLQPQPSTSAPVGIRDYLISLGVDPNLIGYNNGVNGQPGQVTINGQPLNIAGSNIVDSRSYATPEQIQAGINALYPQGNLPVTVKSDDKIIEKGLNDYDQAKKSYEDTIKLILETPFSEPYAADQAKLWEQANRQFDYNPETDPALQQAAKLARKNVLAEMNARGILNSTITADRLKDVEIELLPQYRRIAFDEYNQQISNALQKIGVLQGITEFHYQKYRDWVTQNLDIAGTKLGLAEKSLDNMYKMVEYKKSKEIQKIEERKIAIEEAMNRTNLNGYVTNKDSIILGVKPGTLSETAQQRAWELKQYQEKQKLDLEYELKKLSIQHSYTMEEITTRQEEAQEKKDSTSVNAALAKATRDQQEMYNGYMQIYYGTQGNEFYQNPDRVLQNLLGNPEIAQDVGNDLYKAMIKQAESSASKIATVKETQPTQTEQKYSAEAKLQEILDSQPDPVSYINQHKTDIIGTFGKSFLDNLKKEYGITE